MTPFICVAAVYLTLRLFILVTRRDASSGHEISTRFALCVHCAMLAWAVVLLARQFSLITIW